MARNENFKYDIKAHENPYEMMKCGIKDGIKSISNLEQALEWLLAY